MKQVYLDNAATTALRPEVIERMTNVLKEHYGNASSTHSFGRSSKALLEHCRKNIANYFNASASEIIFTSGGTEADNLALRSAVRDLEVKEIITSKIEHHAVLHTAEQLQKEYGVKLKYVDLDACGLINLEHLEQLLQTSTKPLVSLMHINNEIGNVLDIEKVDVALTRRNILVSGINLLALKDHQFRIGESVILETTGHCHPCSRMEENFGTGGYNAMRGHGGLTTRVIAGGTIKIGDVVRLIPKEDI